MKKIVPLIIIIFAFSKLIAQQAIPDTGFEIWNFSFLSTISNYNTSNSQAVFQYGGSDNVVQDTNAFHGKYSIKLTTTIINGDTVFAYVTNTTGNPGSTKGGIAYSQKPGGIRLYYKCSVPSGDSAAIAVAFKRQGKLIGAYIYPIADTINTYTLFSETFSPALVLTPDTVIFSAISSNTLKGKKGLPGSMLQIDSITFTGVSSQPDSMNGDFENWNVDTTYTLPGWSTFNLGIYRTQDAYMGSYALELITNSYPPQNSGNPIVAYATTGEEGMLGFTGGYPYTQQTDNLELYYKYSPAVISDTAGVSLEFKYSGMVISDTEINLPAAPNYTYVKIPVKLSLKPDSTIVSLFSSKSVNPPNSFVGSTLKVDDIHFKSQMPTGIISIIKANNSFLIYPNPASNQLTIISNKVSINEVRLDNILGQTLIDKNYTPGLTDLKENIDVNNLSTGLYFVTVISGNTVSTIKISVAR